MRRAAGTMLLWSTFAGSAVAAEHLVAVEGGAYRPATIAAVRGDTIRFVNQDPADHNVFVPTVGFATDLGKLEPDKSQLLPLVRAGRFEVECVNHPNMLLTVEVRP